MTNRVFKSQVPASFESDVAAFAAELTSWHGHMAKVGVDPEYVAHPRPTASPAVEASVHVEGDTASPSYELVDDTPTSEEQLRARKDELLVLVSRLEQEASAKAVPIGKRRFFALKETDVHKANAERRFKLLSDEPELDSAELDARAEKMWPKEDLDFLAEQAERTRRLDAVVRHAAVIHHDIEDLTVDSVEGWEPPPFPT